MAFKMTPGIKGNPANSSMMNGGCGGDGQPPCPPRFQAEKITAPVAERSSRSKAIRAKKKVKAPAPAPAPAPLPVKLKLNEKLLDGFRMDRKIEQRFKILFSDLSNFKNQKALDIAVKEFVIDHSGVNSGPVFEGPGSHEGPVFEGPVFEGPIKEGPIFGFPGEVPIKEGPIFGFPGEVPIHKLPPGKFDPVGDIGGDKFKAPALKAPVKKAAAVKAK